MLVVGACAVGAWAHILPFCFFFAISFSSSISFPVSPYSSTYAACPNAAIALTSRTIAAAAAQSPWRKASLSSTSSCLSGTASSSLVDDCFR